MSDLRSLIRELLSEEIAALRSEILAQAGLQAERVNVSTEADLTDFALTVARRAQEPGFLRALEAGQIRYAPEGAPVAAEPVQHRAPPQVVHPSLPSTQAVPLVASAPAAVPELRKSLVTERDIAAIGPDETRLRIMKTTRLTPLASDEARRRRIRIERTLA